MKGRTELPAIPLLISVLAASEAFGFHRPRRRPAGLSLLTAVIDIYKRVVSGAARKLAQLLALSRTGSDWSAAFQAAGVAASSRR